jgi:hypothetical protein
MQFTIGLSATYFISSHLSSFVVVSFHQLFKVATLNMSDSVLDTNKKNTFFSNYNTLLIRHPLLINGIQAALIAGLGVLISDSINGNFGSFDWLEVRTMMIINLVFNTPILLWFFKQLDKIKSGVLTKLLVDQLIFSPVFNSCIIALRLFLIGTDMNDIVPQVIAVVPKALLSSWLFWFPQRYLTLTYVPASYQLLCGSVCGLAWNVIFSMILMAK